MKQDKQYEISCDYNYLNEIPDFQIPYGFLFDKGKVGCGGTSLMLENVENVIICVPFRDLVLNKVSQYPNNRCAYKVFGVLDKIYKGEIIAYLKENKDQPYKVVCTYDALPKVIDAIDLFSREGKIGVKDFSLLIDEFHILNFHYSFRKKVIDNILANYKLFDKWVFMTATPLEREFLLEQIENIPIYQLKWSNYVAPQITAFECKQVQATVEKELVKYLEEKCFGNIHVFVNSVRIINKVIKKLNLTADNCKVVCSKNSLESVKDFYGSTESDPKRINFYTSAAFEGSDIYDRNGSILVVSDNYASHVLIDISTHLIQIVGRIRDYSKGNSIKFLFKTNRYLSYCDSYDEYKLKIDKEIQSANDIVNQYNNLTENAKKLKSENVFIDKTTCNGTTKFFIDKNRIKLDIYNYKIMYLYKDRLSITKALNAKFSDIQYQEDSTISARLKSNPSIRTSFEECFEEYVILRASKSIFTRDDERIRILESKYSLILEAYSILGPDKVRKLQYKSGKIKAEIIKLKSVDRNKILDAFKNEIRIGNKYTKKSLCNILQQIYDDFGINKKIDIRDVKSLVDLKELDEEEKSGKFIVNNIKYNL